MKAATNMTKTEFKKKFNRPMGQTSLRYLNNGLFRDVFKKAKVANHKKHKSVWGYELAGGPLTKAILRERIRYMKNKIDSETWTDRALVFAVHHLRSLERKLKELS